MNYRDVLEQIEWQGNRTRWRTIERMTAETYNLLWQARRPLQTYLDQNRRMIEDAIIDIVGKPDDR